MLQKARERVARMWHDVADASNPVFRADANDTIHFIHEEACEVAKAAMKLGLLGRWDYNRSAEVEAKEYTLADLILEVGDVLLMALTLAQSFDLDPTVCLEMSLAKFYSRSGASVSAVECTCGFPDDIPMGVIVVHRSDCPYYQFKVGKG